MREYYDKCEELHIDIPDSFMKDIIQFNDQFVETQISSIQEVLKNVTSDTLPLKGPSKTQIKHAIQWCELYNLPINESCIHLK